MKARAPATEPSRSGARPAPRSVARAGASAPAPLALQRTIGNRATRALLGRVEAATGRSLDGVAIHTGAAAQRTADAYAARAVTAGRDIWVGPGEPVAGTREGDRLLSHELVHVLQQGTGAARDLAPPDAEHEADRIADAIVAGHVAPGSLPVRARAHAMIARKHKPAAKHKPKHPKAPVPHVDVAGTQFEIHPGKDGAFELAPAGKPDGWKVTHVSPTELALARPVDGWTYRPAHGAPRPLEQRAHVTVVADPVLHGDVSALSWGFAGSAEPDFPLDPQTLRPTTATVQTTANANVQRLAVTSAALSPQPDDLISFDRRHTFAYGELAVGGTLTPDFYFAGTWSAANRAQHFVAGLDGLPTDESTRPAVYDQLHAAGKITEDERAVFGPLSKIEAGMAQVQNYDTGILSFGFAQWTVAADLAKMIREIPADVRQTYLGTYGLTVGEARLATAATVKKFAPSITLKKEEQRQPIEGSFFLDGHELVIQKIIAAGKSAEPTWTKLGADVAAIQVELAATLPAVALQLPVVAQGQAKVAAAGRDPVARRAAKAELAAAKAELETRKRALKTAEQHLAAAMKRGAGLNPARSGEPLERAAALELVVANAKQLAHEAATAVPVEELRRATWVLRFQQLGQDPDAQTAEISSAQTMLHNQLEASYKGVGVPNSRLLRSHRAHAALLSTYYNKPVGAQTGMAEAVATQAAKGGDWAGFPWPASDKKWTTVFTGAAQLQFEDLAIDKLTDQGHDPDRRKQLLTSIPR